jgi:hypothetical protein
MRASYTTCVARTLQQRIAALKEATPRELRDAARSTIGVLVAAAVKAAPADLADELAAAFARLCDTPGKRDPGCRGKIAIARTLHELERWEPAVFETGVRYVQLEPGFGGPSDTAAELRAVCGLAYAHFGRSDAPDVLAELLADPERVTRAGAAQALGDAGRVEAGPLLRFKLLAGDEEPEVLAACCESLLHVGDAVDFVVRLLAAHDERAEVAALALGNRRDARAFEPLVAWCAACLAEQRNRVGYVALALLRSEPATAHLLELVRTGELAAAKALAIFKDDPSLAARVREAAPRSLRREIDEMLGG